MKICKKCGEPKSLGDFQKNKNTKDGLQVHCKICRRLPPRPKRERKKVCSCCKVELTEENAKRRGGDRSDEFRTYCIPCALKLGRESYPVFFEKRSRAARERRLKDPKVRLNCYKVAIRRKYGLSWEEFLRLKTEQGDKCKICGQEFLKTPNVDHCHTTKKIRGLLCQKCNQGMGLFYDSPERLRAAARYLENSDLTKSTA